MRVDQVGNKLREVSIQITDNSKVEVEVQIPYRFDSRSGLDYCLGRKDHACAEMEYLEAIARAEYILSAAK